MDETMRPAEDDPTRREWLLRLGEVAALAGVAGLVPEFATVLTAAQEQAAAALPPGLYEPSTTHLTHVLAESGAVMIPPGTQTDYVQPRRGPERPEFLSSAELPIVSRIADILLGSVDPGVRDEVVEWIDRSLNQAAGVRRAARRLEPGHRALAAAHYGEARVAQLETRDPAALVRSALHELSQQARAAFGRAFADVPADGQLTLVTRMASAAPGSPMGLGYDVLRRETVRGYYTTRAGLRDLNYQGNAFYGACPGCNLG
jgi:hypothetical protein